MIHFTLDNYNTMKQILLIIVIIISWLSLNAQQEKSQKEDILPTIPVEQELTREDTMPQNPVTLEDKLLKQSKIAFASNRDGNFEIYSMNADGSNQTNLTNNPVWDGCLSWSPDGMKIAYSSKREVDGGIYVMNADGSNQTWLINNHAMCPSWSPDGFKIVFYSLIKDKNEETKIVEETQYWHEANIEIYIMNTDGSNQLNLTNNSAYDGYPSWSSFLQIEK